MLGRLIVMIIAVVGFSTPSFAKSIVVEKAWVESEGKEGADLFFVVKNSGSANDRLYAVKSKIAEKVNLEGNSESEFKAGDSKEVLVFDIPAGKATEFNEEGPHVEMVGIKEKLVPGTKFKVTLFFEEAGPIKVDVTVGE